MPPTKTAGATCPKCASQCAEFQTAVDRLDGRMRWSCSCGAGGEFAVPAIKPPPAAPKVVQGRARRWVKG